MAKYKVGQFVVVKLSGGRVVETRIRAIQLTNDGVRLLVSFGTEIALICEWQIVEPK